MAIRTNCTTWFRTSFTGSDASPYVLGFTGNRGVVGIGNESDNNSQLLYFSEPSRSNFDYNFRNYFRSNAVIANYASVNYYLKIATSSIETFTPTVETTTFAPGGASFVQSGDPLSIMTISQRFTAADSATNRILNNKLNSSGSIYNSLFWQMSGSHSSTTAESGSGTHKLDISYTYDDSDLIEHTKTVRIPINSLIGSAICGPTLQILDKSGSFPALDTWLPEVSKSYKDIVVEFYSFSAVNSATNCNLLYNIDQGTTFSSSQYINTANGGILGYDTWRLDTASFDTSISHSIYVGSTQASTFSQLGAIVNVTYTYNVPESTRIMNSIVLTGVDDDGTMQTSTLPNAFHRKLLVSEPGTITLKQSGLILFCSCAATQTVSLKCGNQTYTDYRLLQGSVNSGVYPIIHRIDSNSSGSTAFTMSRGYNTIETYWYANALNVVGGLSGLLYLNYESDKSTLGVGAHNHTIQLTMTGSTSNTQNLTFFWPSSSFIPENNYYINAVSPLIYRYTNTAVEPAQFYAYYTGSEGPTNDGTGYINLGTSLFRGDAEYGTRISTVRFGDYLRRYPNDPDTSLIPIQTKRRYTMQNVATTVHSAEIYVTYNSLTFPITGSISVYTGNGSMPIKIIDTVRNEVILISTSSLNGNISEVWYEDVNNLQIIAYNSSSYAASDIKPAGSGSFSISFASSSQEIIGGEHSYTWIG